MRWRMETFFGVEADRLTRQDFFPLLWRERRLSRAKSRGRIRSFLRGAAEMEREYTGR